MHEIVTKVEIAASAAEVWRALTDFRAYPRWNPVIRWISGTVEAGAVLSVLFHPRGALPICFRARVSVAEVDAEFRWTGKLIASALFAGDHYFILKPTAPKRVELIHGENFAGALAPLMYRLLGNYSRSGFVAINQALKAYVEAGTRPDADAPAQA